MTDLANNKIKVSTYAVLVFMMFSSIALMFFVKYTVYNLRKEITVVEMEIEKSIDKTKILDAEWAYLTSPERIRHLVKNINSFKDYSQIGISQMKNPKTLKSYYTQKNEKYGNNNFALSSPKNELYY